MEFNNYKPIPGAKVTDYIRFVWINNRDKYKTDDIEHYYKMLFRVKNVEVDKLGVIDNDTIFFLNSVDQNPKNKNLLILAGIHGEEPAGPWGLLQFISKLDTDYKHLLHKVNLFFIPIINSYGFKMGCRLNKDGLSVNSGYFPEQGNIQTAEGNLLMQKFDLLTKSAKDGFLNCHENIETDYAYTYCIENTDTIPKIVNDMLNISTSAFGKHPDGIVFDGNLKDGIDFNTHDETLDDYMVTVGKVKRSITTELPGQKDIVKRIDVYEKLILQFVLSSIK